jgi:hypothetical protein
MKLYILIINKYFFLTPTKLYIESSKKTFFLSYYCKGRNLEVK